MWQAVLAHANADISLAEADAEAIAHYRLLEWGEHEEIARQQVVDGYRYILSEYETACNELGPEWQVNWKWLRSLWSNPEFVGKPEVLDQTLYILLALQTRAFSDAEGGPASLRELYERASREVLGTYDSQTRLYQVEPDARWRNSEMGAFEFDSWSIVSAGLEFVADRLDAGVR